MSRTYRKIDHSEKTNDSYEDWKDEAVGKNHGRVPDGVNSNTTIGDRVKIDDNGKPHYDYESSNDAYHEGPIGHKNKKKETKKIQRQFGKSKESFCEDDEE